MKYSIYLILLLSVLIFSFSFIYEIIKKTNNSKFEYENYSSDEEEVIMDKDLENKQTDPQKNISVKPYCDGNGSCHFSNTEEFNTISDSIMSNFILPRNDFVKASQMRRSDYGQINYYSEGFTTNVLGNVVQSNNSDVTNDHASYCGSTNPNIDTSKIVFTNSSILLVETSNSAQECRYDYDAYKPQNSLVPRRANKQNNPHHETLNIQKATLQVSTYTQVAPAPTLKTYEPAEDVIMKKDEEVKEYEKLVEMRNNYFEQKNALIQQNIQIIQQNMNGNNIPTVTELRELYDELCKPEKYKIYRTNEHQTATIPQGRIVKAIYHDYYDENTNKDVTDVIIEKQRSGQKSFAVKNHLLGGDPFPGVFKRLKITYCELCTPEEYQIYRSGEYQTANIPPGHIVKAIYHPHHDENIYKDITDVIIEKQESGENSFAVRNNILGGDPFPGMQKKLKITYCPLDPYRNIQSMNMTEFGELFDELCKPENYMIYQINQYQTATIPQGHIVKAIYHHHQNENIYKDVTDVIIKKQLSGQHSFLLTHANLGGDPFPGIPKKLKITYCELCTPEEYQIYRSGEYQTANIPPGHIVKAIYHPHHDENIYKDITDVIIEKQESGENSFAVRNNILGGDPFPGMQKKLKITYCPLDPYRNIQSMNMTEFGELFDELCKPENYMIYQINQYQTATIPQGHIVKAIYHHHQNENIYKDVTDVIIKKQLSGQHSFLLTHANLGGDPFPGIPKKLKITYCPLDLLGAPDPIRMATAFGFGDYTGPQENSLENCTIKEISATEGQLLTIPSTTTMMGNMGRVRIVGAKYGHGDEQIDVLNNVRKLRLDEDNTPNAFVVNWQNLGFSNDPFPDNITSVTVFYCENDLDPDITTFDITNAVRNILNDANVMEMKGVPTEWKDGEGTITVEIKNPWNSTGNTEQFIMQYADGSVFDWGLFATRVRALNTDEVLLANNNIIDIHAQYKCSSIAPICSNYTAFKQQGRCSTIEPNPLFISSQEPLNVANNTVATIKNINNIEINSDENVNQHLKLPINSDQNQVLGDSIFNNSDIATGCTIMFWFKAHDIHFSGKYFNRKIYLLDMGNREWDKLKDRICIFIFQGKVHFRVYKDDAYHDSDENSIDISTSSSTPVWHHVSWVLKPPEPGLESGQWRLNHFSNAIGKEITITRIYPENKLREIVMIGANGEYDNDGEIFPHLHIGDFFIIREALELCQVRYFYRNDV